MKIYGAINGIMSEMGVIAGYGHEKGCHFEARHDHLVNTENAAVTSVRQSLLLPKYRQSGLRY